MVSENNKLRMAAKINHVKELTLLCRADFDIWADYLRNYKLEPIEFNGKAHILFTVTEMDFVSITFRELVISIFVRREYSGPEGLFLLYAFNSNKFFAWAERTFFSTPYFNGQIFFDTREYSGSDIYKDNSSVMIMRKGITSARIPRYEGFDKWEGSVYLPENKSARKDYKWFNVKISGHCVKYDFLDSQDSLLLFPISEEFKLLRQSQLAGKEWIIRSDGFHSKSKTYISRY